MDREKHSDEKALKALLNMTDNYVKVNQQLIDLLEFMDTSRERTDKLTEEILQELEKGEEKLEEKDKELKEKIEELENIKTELKKIEKARKAAAATQIDTGLIGKDAQLTTGKYVLNILRKIADILKLIKQECGELSYNATYALTPIIKIAEELKENSEKKRKQRKKERGK